jgi:hypothetical protein
VIPEDPGPWSGILEVLQRRGTSPGRRRAEPPNGLMMAPPPRTSLTLAGLDASLGVAGAGPVTGVAAAREPAVALRVEDGRLLGVSRMVRRTWSLPDLRVTAEERPPQDPAAGVHEPVPLDGLADGELPGFAGLAPGGAVALVPVIETPRYPGLVVLRVADRAVLRYIRWARCGAWTADGAQLAVGGDWGILLLEHRAE